MVPGEEYVVGVMGGLTMTGAHHKICEVRNHHMMMNMCSSTCGTYGFLPHTSHMWHLQTLLFL